MFQKELLTDTNVESLKNYIFTVLEKVGILCQNKEMLKALGDKGAKVDYKREKATFPQEMVQELLSEVKEETIKEEENESKKFQAPSLPYVGIQVAQFFYDYEKDEKRRGNKKDFISLIKLGDVLHPEIRVGHSLLLTDVPPILEPLEAGMLMAEYAHKPGKPFAWNIKQIDYLVEMGETYGITNWFSWGAINPAHPFRFDKDTANKFVRRVKSGFPSGLNSMAIAGVTTPVTIAGYIVVASAEIIATWIAARALNPKVPLTGAIWGGTIDMRTGQVSYSAFDAMLRAFTVVEFLRRCCRVTIKVGGGEYCDARKVGLYAALEKAYKAMMIAAFTGCHPPLGEGMIECGKTLSPVQLLLERELGVGLKHFGKSIEVTPETINLDEIIEVGFGFEKTYLESKSTLDYFRSSLWNPELIGRTGWNGFRWEKRILDKTQKKVNALVSQYKKPEVDSDKLARMRKIVEKARKDLLK